MDKRVPKKTSVRKGDKPTRKKTKKRRRIGEGIEQLGTEQENVTPSEQQGTEDQENTTTLLLDEENLKNKPRYIEKSNYLCLMNLPTILEKFGPIRNYWEGGSIGEKSLQEAKYLWYGYTRNWSMNMMQWIYAHRSIERLSRFILTKDKCDVNDYDNTDSMYKRYKNEIEAKMLYRMKCILSVVAIKTNDDYKYYIILKGKRKIEFILNGIGVRSGADWYFEANLGEMTFFVEQENQSIVDYGLCLPMPDSRCLNDTNSMWTITFSDWSVLTNMKKVGLPMLNSIRYFME